MKSFFIERYGKDVGLEFGEQPAPNVREGDVLIEIHAASVNQLDAKVISGEFKMILPHKMPLILGHDVAGVVTKVGAATTRFKVGDEVYGCLPPTDRIGSFAEFAASDERYLALKPENLTFEEAASLPVVALTAWQAFVHIAKVEPRQKVFIQAGSGGVGTIAIQLAKHLKATVATTASEPSAETLKELGADIVVDYRKDDFTKILKDFDVALMSQDEASLAGAISILNPGGTAISISGPPDSAFARQAGLNVFFQLVMWGLSYRTRSKAKRAGAEYKFLFMQTNGEQLREMNPLFESGAIRPILDRVYPFEQTAEAMSYVGTGRAKGKVVVKMR